MSSEQAGGFGFGVVARFEGVGCRHTSLIVTPSSICARAPAITPHSDRRPDSAWLNAQRWQNFVDYLSYPCIPRCYNVCFCVPVASIWLFGQGKSNFRSISTCDKTQRRIDRSMNSLNCLGRRAPLQGQYTSDRTKIVPQKRGRSSMTFGGQRRQIVHGLGFCELLRPLRFHLTQVLQLRCATHSSVNYFFANIP